MTPNTISTRIMVISDAHEHSYDGNTLPDVDVLLHTGDLTNFGELNSLRECVRMLGTINAKSKLVIAGNHDISLDPVRRVENMTDEEYNEYHAAAVEIMTGPAAKSAGIVYLEEGVHSFDLENGAKMRAFPYEPRDDRFNEKPTAQNPSSVVTIPMPGAIDVVMTHGPPHSVLDQVDNQNLGCPNLLRAVGRVRPLLHCFGHIHEGHGANIVTWKPDGSVKNPSSATPLETEQINEFPYTNEWTVKRGEQTLMVNAAIMMNTARGMKPNYKPFIVALELPRR